MEYDKDHGVMFDVDSQRLGVNKAFSLPYTTEPKVLEYKYAFDSLVDDFDKEDKFEKQINLVVCWTVGKRYKARYYFQPLLVGDEGSSRGYSAQLIKCLRREGPARQRFRLSFWKIYCHGYRIPCQKRLAEKRQV